MTKQYKLVVTGPFNSGKTTFVNTLSAIKTVGTDKETTQNVEAKIKPATTVAMDYGTVKLNGKAKVHLFGTPGQDRFDFMRDLLSDGMHGFIFLVDSTDHHSLKPALEMLSLFKKRDDVPYLLVANKADRKGLSSEQLRKKLRLSQSQSVVPCVATDKSSVRAVVEQLVTMIDTHR